MSVLRQESGWNDRFEITVTTDQFVVRRVDADAGWGQNLQLRVTKGGAAPAPRRPTVGDRVRVVGGSKNVGQTGTITQDDHDSSPYKIDFGNGPVSWFKPEQVRLAGDAPVVYPVITTDLSCRLICFPSHITSHEHASLCHSSPSPVHFFLSFP